MAKSKEKLLAREMGRGGESIREIAKKLGVSKGSASL
jgi:AcrR family transcriptional regulator